ncbi:MAG: OprO/OprP family phosphate-selective porin [Gemmatimonadetes bacterium]|nr:OprO/OprP family phosphate-selective porin [Gemmatimonadota bacterium]
MRRVSGVIAGLVLVAGAAGTVSGQGVSVRFSGRIHIQYNTTSVDEGDLVPPGGTGGAVIPASTFETRRIRLAANIDAGNGVTAMIEPDFAGARVSLRNVWMNIEIDPAFELRFGTFKRPFGLIQLTSSTMIPQIERGFRIRAAYDAFEVRDGEGAERQLSKLDGDVLMGEEQELLDRMGYQGYDLGMAAHGAFGRLGYMIGVFNGTGPDARDNTDGKGLAGRVAWQLATGMPVTLAAGASYQERPVDAGGTASGTAVEIDAEIGAFRRPGLHVLAEVVTGENLAADERFAGAQAAATFFVPTRHPRVEGLEPGGRISWGDPDRTIDGDEGLLLTPGVTLYFAGRNRLMLNWDVFVPAGDRFETLTALRAQASVAF